MLSKDSTSREERKELAQFSFPRRRLLNVEAEASRCGMSPLYVMKEPVGGINLKQELQPR